MRKREGNKERDILHAAVKVFAEYGYHASKVSKIAEVAGVANGSVYLYYAGKEELLFKMIENLWRRLAETIGRISGQTDLTPFEKTDAMFDAAFDIFTSNPKLAMVVIQEHNQLRKKGIDASLIHYDNLLASFCKTYEEGVQQNYFDPNVDAPTLLHFIFGGLYHIIHIWVKKPKNYDITEIKKQIKYQVKFGLIKK